ncbi:MAG: hypothetical protein ABSA46_10330 [Thermodesulfovibrionales bacterium]|jgi:hypothetical protein
MEKFLISTFIDSSLYLTMPLKDRMSLLSRLTKSYPTLFISEGFDESTDGDTGKMVAQDVNRRIFYQQGEMAGRHG